MIDPTVQTTIDRLRRAARGDLWRLPSAVPLLLWSALTGKSLMKVLTPTRLASAYLPVSREMGEWLYLTARATKAKRIVEFGSSFGISTLYLAAAARDNGGEVITTEIVPAKCRATEAHLHDAGLTASARVLEGDALQTLKGIGGPIDMVFLDGWKDLYLPVLELLRPMLRPGALIVADNVNMADAKPYLRHMRTSSEFLSSKLFGDGAELSYYPGS
jgi:predicted O-methyltransferase YrrM